MAAVLEKIKRSKKEQLQGDFYGWIINPQYHNNNRYGPNIMNNPYGPGIMNNPYGIGAINENYLWPTLAKAQTASNYYYPNLIIKSKSVFRTEILEALQRRVTRNISKIAASVTRDLEKLKDHYTSVNKMDIIKDLSVLIFKLSILDPDLIIAELTYDNSVVVTFKKDNYSLYVEQFFSSDQEESQFVITAFKGKETLPSYSGTTSDFMECLLDLFWDDYLA